MIGLYGDWGVGKTSLMKQIEKQLDPSKSRAIWFDPWQHQFDESPALALLHTVVDTIGQQRIPFLKEGKKLLTVIAGAFGSMLLKTTTGVKLEEIDKLGQRYEEERFQVREAQVRLREHFENLIEIAQGDGVDRYRLVFFIDDLDRCMPAQTLSLLEALKLFLNLKGCVYFLGVDREALERSIRYHYKEHKEVEISHTSYLEKIVQLPFTIPPIASKSMDQFIGPLLSQELQGCKELLVQGLGDNPRQVKRVINLLTLNDRLARLQNIPGYDPKILAGVLLIQLLDPGLYRIIARQPDLLLKLKSETEENKPLREKHLAGKEQLKEVLSLVHIPEGADLKEYIYLARFAPVAPEAVKTGEKPLDLDAILTNHKKWLDTEGKEGSRADLLRADLLRADLLRADLREANLLGARLSEADLREADLRGADLRDAYLIGADLRGADLRWANLRWANLSEADLRGANLIGADLHEADLSGANLSGADLIGARNLTEKQLASAVTDEATILPDGSKGPFHPGSGAHQPKTESATKEPS